MKRQFEVRAIALLALIMVSSFFLMLTGCAGLDKSNTMEISQSTLSLTEKRTVEIEADLGEEVDLDKLKFEYGEKDFSEWKKWSEDEKFNGASFIEVIEEPSFIDDTTKIKATIEFGLPFDRTDLSDRSIRTEYQQLIGDYELAIINSENGEKATADTKLNVYDKFLFYEARKPAIEDIIEKSKDKNDRYIEYKSLGKTKEGRDLNFVILAKDKKAVDNYLNDTLSTALEDPESLIKKIDDENMGDYQVPIWLNNMHADEVEGPDAQIELLEKFAVDEEVTFNMDDEGQITKETLNIDEVLDDVIFLFAFENNPDGRVANTRENANGFDPNRDNHYQTQIEQKQITEEIAKWTPLSFIDMHGYVEGFLIEPTTPPHNPNYEYDLVFDNMIGQANAMGQGGVGNSSVESYFIPALTMEDGWDDATPAYGATFAMLHGSMGQTVEVPTLGQEGYDAMFGAALGATLYVTNNKDELYKSQLEVFKRGVDGEDNKAVDKYYTNAADEEIGRLRGENESFFPDYYVIPKDDKNQKNIIEAFREVEYLLRNDLNVEQTTKVVTINDKEYPAGTFVIPMNQAKRGFINAMLFDGKNESDWKAMYDPIVVNFPALRGFDIDEIREPEVFKGSTEMVEEITLPTGEVTGDSQKQVLKNSNNDTTKLVNEFLKEGQSVEIVVETVDEINKGDFIVNTKDIKSYEDKYYFESKPLDDSKKIKVEPLEQPKVAVNGSSQLEYSLKELNFNLVSKKDADVIVSDGKEFDSNDLKEKSFIGIGYEALNSVKESGLLPGFDIGHTEEGHEGLLKATTNNHIITSGYQKDELLYTTSGTWITSIPEEADILATVSDDDDFYISGWWPGNEKAKGQDLAFSQKLEDANITLFANDVAFRAHTKHSYRLLSNSIFNSGLKNESNE